MVQTHGLTHVALAVRDLARSTEFYEAWCISVSG
jgi:catechol 2,3-dioxygenase-like lactoylglutathione lyase family enzyme